MTVVSPRAPVIVGVGEAIDRPEQWRSLEPAQLMAEAIHAAERDAGVVISPLIEALDTISEISWPYDDAARLVAELLGISPRLSENGPVGGESPMRYLHRAALRIQAGEIECAVVCGGEAEYSVRKANRENITLDWRPRSQGNPLRAGDSQRANVRALEAFLPINVYPLYENATRARWGMTFAEAEAESASLWSGMSRVAAARAFGWQRRAFSPDEIVTSGPANRMIAWPYPKLMVANPIVNQGAAIVVMSYGRAIEAGISPDQMIYFHGGYAANEPDDLLLRCDFASAWAMRSVLERCVGEHGGRAFDLVELYSCFPVVPKMARRVLDLPSDQAITVTGGLTFFGAPLNNYMGHAAVAMTRALRNRGSGAGLLYGQGGYVTKHHALILSPEPADRLLPGDALAAVAAPTFVGPIHDEYDGPARIESYTVLFDRDGGSRHAIVLAQTRDGGRTIANVPAGAPTIRLLLDTTLEPVGLLGAVSMANGGPPTFAIA